MSKKEVIHFKDGSQLVDGVIYPPGSTSSEQQSQVSPQSNIGASGRDEAEPVPSEKPSEAPTPRTPEWEAAALELPLDWNHYPHDGGEGWEMLTRAYARYRQLERELAAAQDIANRETMNAAYFASRMQAAQSASVASDTARLEWLMRNIDEAALFRVVPQAADLGGMFTFEAIRKTIDAALSSSGALDGSSKK